jgi:hypothetical protein
MSNRELAVSIIDGLSEEKLRAFILLFGNENVQAILETETIANDNSRPRYDSFEDIEKEIFANE